MTVCKTSMVVVCKMFTRTSNKASTFKLVFYVN